VCATRLSGWVVRGLAFVAGNLRRSLDGVLVVMDAEWGDQAALEAFIARLQSGGAPDMAAAVGAATPDFHPYVVTATGLGQEG